MATIVNATERRSFKLLELQGKLVHSTASDEGRDVKFGDLMIKPKSQPVLKIGKHEMEGDCKRINPLAVLRKRADGDDARHPEFEIVCVIEEKLQFKNRPKLNITPWQPPNVRKKEAL